MAKRDYYETLGLTRGASADEIKKAFRAKAKELHPDRNKDDAGAEARFKEVNEAYDVLKDDQKRAAYDRFGHDAFAGGMGASAGHRGAAGGFRANGDFASAFSDVFDDLFGDMMGRQGGQGRARAAMRGNDLRYNLRITLEEAFAGLQKSITVPTSVACGTCKGTGAEGGSEPQTCPTCSGMGKVRAQQGFFTVERTCPTCNGLGQTIKNPCKTCHGAGRVEKEKQLSVNVPVSMATAALGGDIEVPTIDGGRARVRIPEGSQTGRQMRLRGKGMPVLRSKDLGDMMIELAVETPVHLTSRQKEILREFDKLSETKTNPQSAGFFSAVKGFWDSMKG